MLRAADGGANRGVWLTVKDRGRRAQTPSKLAVAPVLPHAPALLPEPSLIALTGSSR